MLYDLYIYFRRRLEEKHPFNSYLNSGPLFNFLCVKSVSQFYVVVKFCWCIPTMYIITINCQRFLFWQQYPVRVIYQHHTNFKYAFTPFSIFLFVVSSLLFAQIIQLLLINFLSFQKTERNMQSIWDWSNQKKIQVMRSWVMMIMALRITKLLANVTFDCLLPII